MSQNNILSISSLNLSTPAKWKIVAKVKNLSEIKEGPTGYYFYVDLIDSSGEIRAMAYKSEADRLYQILEVNSVYSIENGKIQEEKKNFTSNDFEIIFKAHTVMLKQEQKNYASSDSSVASQSQYNARFEYHCQNIFAKDKVFEIDKRLKEIKKEEHVLVEEKLKLRNEKKFIIEATSDLK